LQSRFVADCLLFEEVEGILWLGNQRHCFFDWHVEVLRPYDPVFAQGPEVLFGWATTQNILGLALEAQGERSLGEEGRSLLRNAAEAYDNALRVYTSEQFPYQRAMVQNNLSRALQKLSTPSKTKWSGVPHHDWRSHANCLAPDGIGPPCRAAPHYSLVPPAEVHVG